MSVRPTQEFNPAAEEKVAGGADREWDRQSAARGVHPVAAGNFGGADSKGILEDSGTGETNKVCKLHRSSTLLLLLLLPPTFTLHTC